MSLIRNGGFERGNTDFWTVETDGILEIDDTNQMYGAYCGKYTAGVTALQYVINNDYIVVNPFDLIGLFLWIKSDAIVQVYPAIYLYDADYSYVGHKLGLYRTMNSTYLNINTQIFIPEGVSYIRVGFFINPSGGDVFYFDGYTANIFDADKVVSGNILLGDLHQATGVGDTFTDLKDMQMYKTFEAELTVSYLTGTSPTLNVSIYEFNSEGHEVLLASFAQADATGVERITLLHCTGRQLYFRYTVGGTDVPKISFQVDVAGKG